MKTVIIDPGHGMGNRRRGVYDPGACSGLTTEAHVALQWANELRSILMTKGIRAIRTRVDDKDPAPVSRRDDIAVAYGGDMMLSIHCNSGGGTGTEVFYRGEDDKPMAQKLSATVSRVLGLRDRGPKLEKDSQHKSLAVLEFDKCWLLEVGFIDNPTDRERMLDPNFRHHACAAIAELIV